MKNDGPSGGTLSTLTLPIPQRSNTGAVVEPEPDNRLLFKWVANDGDCLYGAIAEQLNARKFLKAGEPPLDAKAVRQKVADRIRGLDSNAMQSDAWTGILSVANGQDPGNRFHGFVERLAMREARRAADPKAPAHDIHQLNAESLSYYADYILGMWTDKEEGPIWGGDFELSQAVKIFELQIELYQTKKGHDKPLQPPLREEDRGHDTVGGGANPEHEKGKGSMVNRVETKIGRGKNFGTPPTLVSEKIFELQWETRTLERREKANKSPS